MSYRFLNAAGEIDEAKVSIAIERKADELCRWRSGSTIEECRPEATALYRSVAQTERKDWLAEREDRIRIAACAFVAGALEGIAPRAEGYTVPVVTGDGIGSFERAQQVLGEANLMAMQDRRGTFARCLASFDASLARIEASDDITRHLQAAE